MAPCTVVGATHLQGRCQESLSGAVSSFEDGEFSSDSTAYRVTERQKDAARRMAPVL